MLDACTAAWIGSTLAGQGPTDIQQPSARLALYMIIIQCVTWWLRYALRLGMLLLALSQRRLAVCLLQMFELCLQDTRHTCDLHRTQLQAHELQQAAGRVLVQATSKATIKWRCWFCYTAAIRGQVQAACRLRHSLCFPALLVSHRSSTVHMCSQGTSGMHTAIAHDRLCT